VRDFAHVLRQFHDPRPKTEELLSNLVLRRKGHHPESVGVEGQAGNLLAQVVMELAGNPFALLLLRADQTAGQGPQILPALLKRPLRSSTFRYVHADRSPANGGAVGVADVEDVVDHPDRLTSFEMPEANFDLAVAVAQHTREKLIRDERLIFWEEAVLDFDPKSFFEIVQPDQSQTGGAFGEVPFGCRKTASAASVKKLFPRTTANLTSTFVAIASLLLSLRPRGSRRILSRR
jgi:hypothetical protein